MNRKEPSGPEHARVNAARRMGRRMLEMAEENMDDDDNQLVAPMVARFVVPAAAGALWILWMLLSG